jgi:type II secretory pathway component GspD/PulD (secretin)
MKYLITESQLDKIIYKYLDNQDFIQIEKNDKVYFVNSEGDEHAQIRFDKDDDWCMIYYELVNEISRFFSIQNSDSKQVIGKWVENTLQMKVTNTSEVVTLTDYGLLRIPYYN